MCFYVFSVFIKDAVPGYWLLAVVSWRKLLFLCTITFVEENCKKNTKSISYIAVTFGMGYESKTAITTVRIVMYLGGWHIKNNLVKSK